MSLEEINKPANNQEFLLNNLNDFIIQIDYFDHNGIRKRKNKIPLKYIFNSKFTNFKTSIWQYINNINYLIWCILH
mgnify:CR=1 FL=1